MTSAYDILIQKIDQFIRRYYLNQLIRGSLFFAAGFVVLLIVISALESVGYFTTNVRFFLFYGFIAYNVVVFLRYVLLPFLGILRIGRKVGAKEAARILGTYFKEEIRDKVTNALELRQFLDSQPERIELLEAAIDQKASAATVVPFNKAINIKGNLKYLPFFVIPFFVGLGIYLLAPGFFSQPVNRIVRYDMHFEKPSPFQFVVDSDLTGFRNENLTVQMKAQGHVLPSGAEVLVGGSRYRLDRLEPHLFTYMFRNLQDDFIFYVMAEGFRFGPYQVDVHVKPSLSHFTIEVIPPTYTRLSPERFVNIGDITVAEGSRISWEFNTRATGYVLFYKDQKQIQVNEESQDIYTTEIMANAGFQYLVQVKHDDTGVGDSLQYDVLVRADQHPRIQVESVQDSVMLAHIFHRGIIQDDYGFSKLEFAYKVVEDARVEDEDDATYIREQIDIDKTIVNQTFYHHIDVRTLYLRPGETIEYFFEVYDNDAIRGPKSTRSRLFSYYIPTREEMLAKTREDDETIREELSGGIGEVQEARQDLDHLRRQLLESDRISWEQQESIRDMLNKQQELEERMDQLSDFKRKTDIQREQFKESSERVKEKQEELQRIFDEVLSDELKDLFDQIREELEKLNRDEVYEMLSRMEFEFRDLEHQMDRALELFRQLEMERMLQESLELLTDLKESQDQLAEETESADSTEGLSEKQQELKERFDQVQEMLEDFRDKNKELSRPMQLDDTSELEQGIQQDMQDAADQLDQGDQQGGQQMQQDAGSKMDALSQRLQSMQQNMFMEQLAEDARALRQILENLIKTSFAQEDLLLEIRQVNVNDPRYVDFIQEQRKIHDDLRMIEDSLIALSKRQAQIESYVTREIAEIGINLRQGIHHLIERQRGQASSRQQFVMTHINNLALLLNESLQNMQMQMAGSSGMGMPQMGEGSEPSFQNMREMQEQLNQMLQQMQDGHQPMPGEIGEQPMSVSEAMARMAAEQEAIRKELQKMTDQLRNEGFGEMEELRDLQQEMERTELDMVRKQVNRQTINRQEQILTRLLEHERAELQREMEEKRVGTTAYDYEISNPEEIFEYNRIRNRELEMLRSLPPGLKPFYRTLVENYFLNVQE